MQDEPEEHVYEAAGANALDSDKAARLLQFEREARCRICDAMSLLGGSH